MGSENVGYDNPISENIMRTLTRMMQWWNKLMIEMMGTLDRGCNDEKNDENVG
jgi:hypothetical protein